MIVIDVETVKRVDLPDELFPTLEDIKAPSNYKDEAKIKEYGEKKLKDLQAKMGLDPTRNQICSYAILAVNDIDGAPTVLNYVSKDELSLLGAFKNHLDQLKDAGISVVPFITFNGMRFDLGALIAAHMRRAVPIPGILREVWTMRYSDLHVDMYRVLGEDGSLHDWCHSLGIKPPVGKGDMVQGWFDGNDLESIKVHNISDVWATWDIYRRWENYGS